MNRKILLCLVACLCIVAFSQRTPEALADQVKQLDGYYNYTGKFEMYSGYLMIQQQPEISIHYVFITSMRDSPKDDVTLWLNGGPGCSSLLGFAQQVGPNMLLSGSKVFSQLKNPYSWNTISNMLFFQSPAGVGFSINNDKQYQFNDTRTAQDGLKALQAWYKRFPEFKSNNFWISGESYCGMYIPFLANQVLSNDASINLKGILIGNGAMLLDWNWRRMIGDKFWMNHYYYGPEISKLISNCKYTDEDEHIPSCARGMAMADRATDLVNPYMTTGICYTPSQSAQPRNPEHLRFPRISFHKHRNPKVKNVESGSDSPCTDDQGIQAYFNIDKVKQQLHIKNNVTWQSCSERVGENYHMNLTSLGLFDGFKQKGLKILLYSGNVDAVVPYVQTEEYIKKIGWKQTQEKKPLVNARGSLMGWNVQYEGLTYAIINGAGHMVPGDKPHAAYEMFKSFIERKTEQKQMVSQ